MKNRSVTLCLLTATLFAAPAFAASAPAESVPPTSVPQPGSRPGREEMIKRFDQDGDGKLSETERQAAREQGRQKWAQKGDRRGPGGPDGKLRERMLKRFDQDGDGKLSDAEKVTAKKAVKKMRHKMQHRMMHRQWQPQHRPHAFGGPRGPHGFRGPGGPQAPMRQAMLKRFDQDGDGRLSDTERGEARKAGEAMRTRAREHHQEALSRFDADGDGKLGETERQTMRDAWQKFLSQQPPAIKK